MPTCQSHHKKPSLYLSMQDSKLRFDQNRWVIKNSNPVQLFWGKKRNGGSRHKLFFVRGYKKMKILQRRGLTSVSFSLMDTFLHNSCSSSNHKQTDSWKLSLLYTPCLPRLSLCTVNRGFIQMSWWGKKRLSSVLLHKLPITTFQNVWGWLVLNNDRAQNRVTSRCISNYWSSSFPPAPLARSLIELLLTDFHKTSWLSRMWAGRHEYRPHRAALYPHLLLDLLSDRHYHLARGEPKLTQADD